MAWNLGLFFRVSRRVGGLASQKAMAIHRWEGKASPEILDLRNPGKKVISV